MENVIFCIFIVIFDLCIRSENKEEGKKPFNDRFTLFI